MSQIYSSDSFHLTFFTEEKQSKKLQDFIQACTEKGFVFSITPYGVTSVAVLRAQRNVLIKLFEKFFSKGKKQESMVLNVNTQFPAFVPYNSNFQADLAPYIGVIKQVDERDIKPVEILHFLDLHEDMQWSFVEKVLSLPVNLGKQIFLPGQILTRIEKETYFENLEELTPYLGTNGYFQFLYKNAVGKTAFCREYYEKGAQNSDEIQPTCRGQIPSPVEYVIVKPMWYDYEYK